MDLVGGIATLLKNMSSSIGMMNFPTEWENKSHVPNHQPETVLGAGNVVDFGSSPLGTQTSSIKIHGRLGEVYSCLLDTKKN